MKFWKTAAVALLAAAAGAIILHTPFYKSCEEIRGSALRLHIVANSDSETDQSAKLAVRDAVLEATRKLFEAADSSDGAKLAAGEAIPAIESAARAALNERGLDYEVSAKLCSMYFDQLDYGGATLPAGVYDALRVELGEAQGKNWWCVMYPPLCVLSATDSEQEVVGEAFDERETEIVLGGEKYAVRFFAEQLIQRFKLWTANLASD